MYISKRDKKKILLKYSMEGVFHGEDEIDLFEKIKSELYDEAFLAGYCYAHREANGPM